MDNSILLYSITLFHLFIDVFLMFFIFIFTPIYDFYYCSFVLLQTIHWGLLNNECIISYIEKKLINNDYQLGDNSKWIPHYQNHFNQYTITLKAILILGTLLYIIFRNKKNNAVRFIASAGICLWIYYTYLY
jgi:hypothetical protein